MRRMFRIERETAYQIMFSILALINLVPTGMTVGYSAISLPYLNNTMDINLTDQQSRLFTSIPSIFMLFGCITSIYTLTLGRRLAISIGSLTNILGWTLIASSYNVSQLLSGRVVAGFAMGLCTVPGVAYISEITTIKLAPTLNSCSSLFISLGMLLIYFLGYVIEEKWRIVAGCSVLVSVISTLSATLFLPESPRWLLIKNQEEKARKSLRRLRGLKTETEAFQTEFINMVEYNKCGEKGTRDKDNSVMNIQDSGLGQNVNKSVFQKLWLNFRFLVSIMKLPEVWKPFLILNSFFFFQQFCGIYVISAYAVKVITSAGITQNALLVTVIIGILQISGELAQILSSSSLGRRRTAIISGVGMTISITTLGAYNQFLSDSNLSEIPLTSILIFVDSVFWNLGFGTLKYPFWK
ncbi:facilitated trehalose transporter Tret1-like [Belonocnema kinseyi]|uniref:facilitated trehalose transporter Tret1-like n=1 Tax=Belonocnema kinseyi TaxID=2817044 RepID=UPI00143DA836|nr:facilitated trehalose transporter Tret1-like [Belonocnema kinseyi]